MLALKRSICSFILLLTVSAALPKAPSVATDEPSAPADFFPQFDGLRAFQYLRALVEIGPRSPGTPGALEAQSYIKKELRQLGLEVKEQTFSADTPLGEKTMQNIIAVIPGRSDAVLLLAAHYDTKYFEKIKFVGANDGASGSAILLESAHCIQPKKFGPSIWLVFFDGEEALAYWSERDSLYGSRHFIQSLKDSGELGHVKAMILLDMVGDAHLSIESERNSTPWLRDIVWEHAHRLGFSKAFTSAPARIDDDHIPFLREKIPALDIIDFRYGPDSRSNEFWHTSEDTLDKVSPDSLEIVGKVVLSALPDIAAAVSIEP
jgi:glutaminyl-peptide cyclotransferase